MKYFLIVLMVKLAPLAFAQEEKKFENIFGSWEDTTTYSVGDVIFENYKEGQIVEGKWVATSEYGTSCIYLTKEREWKRCNEPSIHKNYYKIVADTLKLYTRTGLNYYFNFERRFIVYRDNLYFFEFDSEYGNCTEEEVLSAIRAGKMDDWRAVKQ